MSNAELIKDARKAQKAVYLAGPESVAEDLHRIIKGLADALEAAEQNLATAHADLAWVKKWVARPGGATDDELDELRSYLSQSFTGTESEQNG